MNRKELIAQIRERRSFLCVGLDPDLGKVPERVRRADNPLYTFNRAVIDATAPYCVAYKPNLAFYEACGLAGWRALEQTVKYLRTNYPNHFLIADAKRGDIGNTSAMYARALFGEMDFDALTVAPYMGSDSVTPFLKYAGKWVVLLALTSNTGSHDFQLTADASGERLFEKVIRTSQAWANDGQMMYVVGATQGSLFADVRRLAPRHFLLVPGVGAQGGSLAEVCRYGMTDECGLLVNSSRGIIHASQGDDFVDAAARAAQDLQKQMDVQLSQHGI